MSVWSFTCTFLRKCVRFARHHSSQLGHEGSPLFSTWCWISLSQTLELELRLWVLHFRFDNSSHGCSPCRAHIIIEQKLHGTPCAIPGRRFLHLTHVQHRFILETLLVGNRGVEYFHCDPPCVVSNFQVLLGTVATIIMISTAMHDSCSKRHQIFIWRRLVDVVDSQPHHGQGCPA